jgi:hypothetical protein
MAAAGKQSRAKRAGKRRVRAPASDSTGEFCTRAREALRRGTPDTITDKNLQQVLTAAVKIYAAKVERRGRDVAPFTPGAVTATETVVAACGMIRAADLNMFDVAIWFHRPQGLE